MSDTNSDESVHANHAPVQVMREGNTRLLPWLMLCGILSGFACALSIFTLWQGWITERDESRLFVMVQDQNALMLREGIKLPTDEVYGPGNNLEYGMKGDGHGRNRVPDSEKRNPPIQRGSH